MKTFDSLMKAMLLAVAFAANIGGIGTLIGTPVNLIMGQQLESIFTDNLNGAEPAGEINFLTWMYFAFPVAIVCVFGCWVWLVVFYMGPTKVINDLKKRTETDEDQRVKKQIRDKYNALGKMSYEEWIVGFHFGMTHNDSY
jgi:sodium-dependent dicarboxylate transporter 2/3/5